jgi:hypothetical protein
LSIVIDPPQTQPVSSAEMPGFLAAAFQRSPVAEDDIQALGLAILVLNQGL